MISDHPFCEGKTPNTVHRDTSYKRIHRLSPIFQHEVIFETSSPYDFCLSPKPNPQPGLQHHQRVDLVVGFHREEGCLVATNRDGLLDTISRRGSRRYCTGTATWKDCIYLASEWQIFSPSRCTGRLGSCNRT